MQSSFGEWLKQRRKILGLTQKELGNDVGCSAALIRKIERGQRRPSLQIANLIIERMKLQGEETHSLVTWARLPASSGTSLDSITSASDHSRMEEKLRHLTEREFIIFKLIQTDLTNDEIAEQLSLKVSSIRSYINQVYSKLDIHSRAEAISLNEVVSGTHADQGDRQYGGRIKVQAALTSLVGRVHQIAEIGRLLEDSTVRLLTLVGPPGVGKTRLSLELASRLQSQFLDGVFFIPLETITDAEFMMPLIAHQLGIFGADDEPLSKKLTGFLHEKSLLLILDNFEHVVTAAPLIGDLLSNSIRLKVLATSREPLGIKGENQYPVPPLDLTRSRYSLDHSEASELFLQRARAVQPNLTTSSDDMKTVAEICKQLDGLPLAIELAAARVKLYSLNELLIGLDNRLSVAVGGARYSPERHQTLRSALDWSYELLDSDEKALLACLSVFVGGWSLETVKLCTQGVTSNVHIVLESLINKNLVRQTVDAQHNARFSMLHTIREFALEKLLSSEHKTWVHEALVRWFLNLTETASAELRRIHQLNWRNAIKKEYPNIRYALQWSLEHNTEDFLRLTKSLCLYWWIDGDRHEAVYWLNNALASSQKEAQEVRGNAFHYKGLFAYEMGNTHEGKLFLEQSLEHFMLAKHMQGVGLALDCLGEIALFGDDLDDAHSHYSKSKDALETVNDEHSLPWPLIGIGHVALAKRNFLEAQEHYQRALTIRQSIGDLRGQVSCMGYLGNLALVEGDEDKAHSYYAKSLHLFYRSLSEYNLSSWNEVLLPSEDYDRLCTNILQHLEGLRQVLDSDTNAANYYYLAHIALTRSQIAEQYFKRQHEFPKGNLEFIVYAFAFFASIDVISGRFQRALQLLNIAKSLHEQHDVSMLTLLSVYRHVFVRNLCVLHNNMDDEGFVELKRKSARLTLTEALALIPSE